MSGAEKAKEAACHNCLFFIYHGKQDYRGRCRRRPPIPIGIGTSVQSYWSEVDDGSWCGEWKPSALYELTEIAGK